MCLILHNMIVDMWERGEVRSEVGGGGEEVDVVGEFAGDVAGVGMEVTMRNRMQLRI